MARAKETLIKEMMENYPEASNGMSLICTAWSYKKMEFSFFDEEDEKYYKVNLPSLKKGLNKLLEIIGNGKYFNNGVIPNLLSEGYDYDGQDCDALVQCAILGDIIYG